VPKEPDRNTKNRDRTFAPPQCPAIRWDSNPRWRLKSMGIRIIGE